MKLATLKPRVQNVFLGVRNSGTALVNRSPRPEPKDWAHRRLQVLKRDLYRCQGYPRGVHAPGCNGVATEVDHIDGDSMNNPLDNSNYQSLSKNCHSVKTVKENGGFKLDVA